jgi:archaellum component FlaC
MSDINLKPLFEYLDEKFTKNDERFDKIENDIQELRAAVDRLAKMVQDFRDEHIVIHKRLEVLEDWAKQVSKKVGIALPE